MSIVTAPTTGGSASPATIPNKACSVCVPVVNGGKTAADVDSAIHFTTKKGEKIDKTPKTLDTKYSKHDDEEGEPETPPMDDI